MGLGWNETRAPKTSAVRLRNQVSTERGSRQDGAFEASQDKPELVLVEQPEKMIICDIRKQEAGKPEMVTHLDALAGSDLELPLCGHDLGVGAGDVDTGIQASLVVGLNDVALDDLAGADTAVVRALRGREAVSGLEWIG